MREKMQSARYSRMLRFALMVILMQGYFSSFGLSNSGGKSTDDELITVSGTITDENGEGLPGATVFQKGNSENGTVTDIEGNFKLTVSDDAVLIVSFVGYKTQEVLVQGKTTIKISLEPDFANLDEVVVVGYGTQKKSDVTGSVYSVPQNRLSNLPVTNLSQSLEGTVAGLNVTQSSSVPGSTGSIQIRGLNSINLSTSPFIVVDGTPFYGNLQDINTNNVKSIEILKDASATAIYGTRGSNGVILITTKRGTKDTKPMITYNAYYGIEGAAHVLKPMGPDAYVQKYHEYMTQKGLNQTTVLLNSAEIDNYYKGVQTNWWDVVSQMGSINQHNLSIAGATDRVNYMVSGNFMNETGIIKGYGYQRVNLRSNLDIKVTDWMKVGMNAFMSNNNYSSARANMLMATSMSPYATPYDSTGGYSIYPMYPELLYNNPLLGLTTTNNNKDKTLSGTGYMELNPIKGLTYRLNATYFYHPYNHSYYNGRAANDKYGTADIYNQVQTNWVLENILTYSKDINKHHFDVTALYSAQEREYNDSDIHAVGFTTDALKYNNVGAGTNITASSNSWRTALESQMLRLNYGFDSRYMVTLTARRDGYSAFGGNTSKYGFFPSAAVKWNIHNESFLKAIPQITQMSLRVSRGRTGNSNLDAYVTQTTSGTALYPFGGTALVGTTINNMGNGNLHWETTTSNNIALDFGLFKQRVSGTVELYKTVTDGLVMKRRIPNITGNQTIWANVGKMQNAGIELTLNLVPIETRDFTWNVSANFAHYNNKILDLYGDHKSDTTNQWFIGKSLKAVYTYKKEGIWQEGEDNSRTDPTAKPGYIKFADINHDGKIDAHDRMYQGNGLPRWTGGLTNTFTYKNWSLLVFLQTSQGVLKTDQDLAYGDEIGRRNIPAQVGYWTPQNKSNTWPSLVYFNTYGYSYPYYANYVRLKNVRISYDVKAPVLEKLKIQKLKVYVAGMNLYTFTKWIGWDPESSQAPRGSGDWTNNYPVVRTISLGINVTL